MVQWGCYSAPDKYIKISFYRTASSKTNSIFISVYCVRACVLARACFCRSTALQWAPICHLNGSMYCDWTHTHTHTPKTGRSYYAFDLAAPWTFTSWPFSTDLFSAALYVVTWTLIHTTFDLFVLVIFYLRTHSVSRQYCVICHLLLVLCVIVL